MSIQAKASGSYYTSVPHVKAGGSWHACQSAWVRVSGVWQKFYSARSFTAGPFSISDSNVGSPSFAAVGYDANGIVYQSIIAGSTDIGEWTTPSSAGIGSSGGYYIRADVVSGSVDGSSSATGTDLALSLTRSWSVTRNTIGTKTAALTVTIKDGSGGSTLATGTVTLTADVS